MKTKFLLLITIFFTLTSEVFGQYCTSDARYTEVEFFNSSEITVGSNIQFGTALDYLGNPVNLVMDLYYPNLGIDTSAKRPFVMLFHGGGFTSGDKQSGDIKDLCIHLARRGFVCASVNYRLGFDFSEYGQYKARYRAIQDGHAAMRFVVNNASAVRIDTNWLFVGGQSAGSLLAMGMVYADPIELDSVSILYNTISTSAELGNLYTSGNSLTNTYSIKGIFNNWGGITSTEVDANEMIPTIAFHGALDTTVLIDEDNSFLYYSLKGSRALYNDLRVNSICSELTIDTNGGHGIFRNTSSMFRASRAACFFKSIFCSNCTSLYTTDSIPTNCSVTLGFEVEKEGTKVKVFPNPFEHSFTIDGLDGNLEISIINSYGQLIYKVESQNGMVQIDLLKGLYILKIKELKSNKTYIKKLIRD